MKIVLLAEIKYLLFAGLIATLYFPFNNLLVFNFAIPLESVLIMKYLLNLVPEFNFNFYSPNDLFS